ncbi:MAG: hypothetical protein C0482_16110 [Gordonia sp.]|nr:hypothetical protein [Gordonia sp. (in: high G+C Gram-positive bacteria)]
MHAAFVKDAPYEPERQLIYQALILYADILKTVFTAPVLWIDGGFVTHKHWEAPKDADVVVVVPWVEYSNVCTDPKSLAYRTLQGVQVQDPPAAVPRVQPMGGLIDGFIIPDQPLQTAPWHNIWSRVKDDNGNVLPATERKGYLEVQL